METVLVSVISAQTIPNLLLINELKHRYSAMLFITTASMEGGTDPAQSRSIWIERAAGIIPGSVRRIIVEEDNWPAIRQKLSSLEDIPDQQYMVNLTGGTKVMTLAVYEHFARPGNVIYYVPFPKNEYRELYPYAHHAGYPLNTRCNLPEYLTAHGLHFTSSTMLTLPCEETQWLFNRAASRFFELRSIPEIENAHDMLRPELKTYFSGGWFEEFVFTSLKTALMLREDQAAMNVKLFRNPEDIESDNEFDVVFVADNAFYVIECKSSTGSPKNMRINTDKILYKLGAITKDFGLNVNSYLLTLSRLRNDKNEFPEKMDKRRKILGIRAILDQYDFQNMETIILKIIQRYE